jgi:outer membrane protein TolC
MIFASSAALARVQADYSAKSAHGTLAVVIGSPADQPLKLDAEPVPAEVPALTARMADLMAEAVRQRPDLAAALAQRDSAQASITVALARQTRISAELNWEVSRAQLALALGRLTGTEPLSTVETLP